MMQENNPPAISATKAKFTPFSDATRSASKEGRLCPRCQGSGICIDCQGSGQMTCPNCQGSGISGHNSQGVPLPCRTCKGRKTVPCSKVCESCQGSGRITPDLQQKIFQKSRFSGQATAPIPPLVTQTIMAVCLSIYILQLIWPLQFRLLIFPWLSPYMPTYAPWEIWRLVTAAFLHGGFFHLLCNLYCLYLIGPELEDLIGHKHFTALFIGGCVGGNTLSVFLNTHSGGIGASTGILALLVGYWAYNRRWALGSSERAQAYGQGTIFLLALGFALTYFMNLAVLDNWGHLGGALTGWAYVQLSQRPS